MDVILLIGYLSILFVGGSLIAKLAEKFGIPDIPLLLMFGLAISFFNIMPKDIVENSFNLIGNFGLIILLFIGSYEMEWSIMKKVLGVIVKLDIIALLILFAISGIIFNWVFHLPILSIIGFLFGAIVCATDPATLIPIFSKMDINPEVAITLEAESVFNDPLGIVFTSIILSMMGLAESLNPILNFLSLAIGGIILGLIGGIIFEKVVLKYEFNEYVAPLSIGTAMFLWYFGDAIFPYFTGYEISGFMAVAIMGLYLGNTLTKYPEKSKDVSNIDEFCADLSTVVRILIFVFLGASISLSVLSNYWIAGLLCAIGSIFFARPLGVFLATSIPPSVPFKERLYFSLEGPRGVVPAALSATVYATIMKNPHLIPQEITKYMPAQDIAGSILVATFMTILLSVILEASWADILAKKLFKG